MRLPLQATGVEAKNTFISLILGKDTFRSLIYIDYKVFLSNK